MLANIPRLLPDQTLDSVAALALLNNGLYGNRKAATEVFGKYAVSISESWKGGVRNLYDKLGLSREMSAGEFLDNHTALLIFKPFMSAERYADAQKKILDIQLSGITQQLGITGAPFFKPSHCYCLECMTQELRDMGYAFPHRVHQLVGVALCPFHDTKLGNLDREDQAFHCVNGLVLPVALPAPPLPSLNVSTDPGYLEASRKFGTWVHFILDKGLPHFPIEQRLAVVEAKLQALEKGSDVPNSTSARLEYVLRRNFGTGFLRDLGWELNEGPTSHWPAMLLQGQTYAEQPIANILVLAALFEHPQEYMAMVTCTSKTMPGSKRVTTVRRSRARLGITRELIRDFLSMPSLKEIAKKHGRYVDTVKAQLYALPGLAERRKEALFRRRRRRYRQLVERMLKDKPNTSRFALMQSHMGCYNWLLKNDVTWFDDVLPRKEWWCKQLPAGNAHDVSKKVLSVVKQLREFVVKITTDLGAIRITKGLLLKQIDKENQSLLRKGQLPQAAAFIQGAMETVSQYESRVIGHIRLLLDQGDRIGCQVLATQFLRRNNSRVDLLKKVTGVLLGVVAQASAYNRASSN